MTSWPVEIDGREYEPIPASWIQYGHDEGEGEPRLYAVSAAVTGRQALHIRYLHPTDPGVLHVQMRGADGPDGGTVPAMLTSSRTWPRSTTPAGQPPSDVARVPEYERLRELWGERVDEISTPVDADEELIADGGRLTCLDSEALLRSALEQVDHDRERELIREALQLDIAGPRAGGGSR